MPVTIDQKLQRALIEVAENSDASPAERLKACCQLIAVRKGKAPRKYRRKAAPLAPADTQDVRSGD